MIIFVLLERVIKININNIYLLQIRLSSTNDERFYVQPMIFHDMEAQQMLQLMVHLMDMVIHFGRWLNL